jgi:hypothetical protein
MLESKKHESGISSIGYHGLRETWIRFLRAFLANFAKISRRLLGMGESRISRRLDEELQQNVLQQDTTMMDQKTREELYSSARFEWVKTERAGDVCSFQKFEEENDVEYVVFDDNSRLRIELLGDVVLVHTNEFEILGREILPVADTNVFDHVKINEVQVSQASPTDPVVAILEKTKKKTEKINISLTLKIPSPELYAVIRENFENTDEILLENVMLQVQEKVLREAVKKELQNIYSKKKKS